MGAGRGKPRALPTRPQYRASAEGGSGADPGGEAGPAWSGVGGAGDVSRPRVSGRRTGSCGLLPLPPTTAPNGSSGPSRDSVEWEGRSLLKALIKKAALGLVYYDLFRDPLNWAQTGEALPGGPLGALQAMCERTDPGPVTVALDSLSWLLLRLPCAALCQALCAMSRQHACRGGGPAAEQLCVLGLLHRELHGPGPMGALSSLAQTEVTLSGTAGQASAHILCRRPRQRPTLETLWFSVLPDLSLDPQGGPPLESQPHPDPHTRQVDPASHLTFNLHLSKREREAKDSLTLPFQFSSEKQQALLCPGPGPATSRIFYEPDAFDDLDPEDPDGDLDV
ncbi:elongator complex protein 5 isoform X2 [Herpailurus yagouaroundi]|uniref:elongator complex protein 5 isoform X2 n=1 Tax=Herpailurus yagouaroundi TaxID=1608482 RepID=UPI001AD7B4B0|nr:elongator complex protein 5 isoform X2 [Puma yagouaroundi]